MLAILGMMSGGAISKVALKYIVIFAIIGSVMFTIWLGFSKYNEAISDNAANKLLFTQQVTETQKERTNTLRVKAILNIRDRENAKWRKLAHERRIAQKQATRALALYLNTNNSTAVNDQLCSAAASIQGSPINGCGKEVLCTGEACSKSDNAASYKISNSTVKAIHSALVQCGQYVESVVKQQPIEASK